MQEYIAQGKTNNSISPVEAEAVEPVEDVIMVGAVVVEVGNKMNMTIVLVVAHTEVLLKSPQMTMVMTPKRINAMMMSLN